MSGRKSERDGSAAERGNAEPPEPTVPKPDPAKVSPEDREEIGGPKGPEPTRYGDWEKGGRCSDF
jgi:hypothetical protein